MTPARTLGTLAALVCACHQAASTAPTLRGQEVAAQVAAPVGLPPITGVATLAAQPLRGAMVASLSATVARRDRNASTVDSGSTSSTPAVEASPIATALVRTWVAEARWTAHRDHAAQAHVLQRWADKLGFSLLVAIETRVLRFSNPPKWITRIEPTCSEPAGFPRRWSWASHADECKQLYANAASFLRGELADPCRGRARGWRAPGPAFEAALALGRQRVWCGQTANRYVR